MIQGGDAATLRNRLMQLLMQLCVCVCVCVCVRERVSQ